MLVFYRTKSGKIVCFDDGIKIPKKTAKNALKDIYLKQKYYITSGVINNVKKLKSKELNGRTINKIYDNCKKLLTKSRNDNDSNEVLCIMTKDNDIYVNGKQSYVEFGDSVKDIIKKSPDNSLTIIHNHPSGYNKFSLPDLINFLDYNSLKTSVLVTNKGRTSFITKTNNYNKKRTALVLNNLLELVEKGEISKRLAVDILYENMYSLGIERG